MEKGKILFLDDDELVLSGFRRAVHNVKDMDFVFEADPIQALRIIEKDNIDILVSDMVMPNIPGQELLDRTRHLSPFTYQIVLSGHSSRDRYVHAMVYADMYCTKPIPVDILKEKFRKVLAEKKEFYSLFKERICFPSGILLKQQTYENFKATYWDKEVTFEQKKDIFLKDQTFLFKMFHIANGGCACNQNCFGATDEVFFFLRDSFFEKAFLNEKLFSVIDNQQQKIIGLDQIYYRSLTRKILAQYIAKDVKTDSSNGALSEISCFFMDIGQIYYRCALYDLYGKEFFLSGKIKEKEDEITCLRVTLFLMKQWGVPNKIVEALKSFSDKNELLQKNPQDIAVIIYFADKINKLAHLDDREFDQDSFREAVSFFNIEKDVRKWENFANTIKKQE